MPNETVFGADFKILKGMGAPDRAKGARTPKLKVPTTKGTKAAPKMSSKTTTLKKTKKKTYASKLGGY